MTFGELVRENSDSVVKRWLDDALATYPEDTAIAFGRRKNRFDNPVGHSLREGTREIFKAVLDGADDEKIRPHLFEIIRIRAIQELSASQAVGFVFSLKKAVRSALGDSLKNPAYSSDLAEFEQQVDRLALIAFDVYAQCREQYYELRVSELKRQIPWAVSRMNRGGDNSESAPVELRCEPPES